MDADLFGRGEPPKVDAPKRSISAMHWCYGVTPGRKCGECEFLAWHQPGQNRYAKCSKASITHGPAIKDEPWFRYCCHRVGDAQFAR